jgi:hypothetical protein
LESEELAGMITLNLMGGLGNQAFIYALGRALEFRGQKVQYDTRLVRKGCGRIYLLDKLGLSPKIGADDGWPTIVEGSLRFKPEILEIKTDCILHGYWQSEKYFADIRGVLLKEIFNRMEVSEASARVAQQITDAGERSCFIHVRRTDNLRPVGLTVHGLLNDPKCRYYQNAIPLMREKVPGVRFFVFSDDPEWIRENMNDADMQIVGHNLMSGFLNERLDITDREGGTENEDLWLMSLCHHAICANSTFAWWGAWLNAHECEEPRNRFVFAPDPWFESKELDSRDILPERWTKVPIL